ncbi:MAG: hypothetical protein M1820_005771 [Bogoriella megaspora]|nr:MAG: hypothetical protein M1820_005771 [Bogoriella megaspora]
MTSLFGPPSPFEKQSPLLTFLSSPVQTLLYVSHHILQWLRAEPTPSDPPVRIVCISDTHTLIPSSIPDGDILIHAGDLTNEGTPSELHAHLTWLASLPHKHKIVIGGNHDTQLDPRSRATLPEPDRSAPLPDWSSFSIHYLQHSSITLNVQPNFALLPQTKSHSHPHSNSTSRSTSPSTTPLLPRSLTLHGSPQIPQCGPASFAFQHPAHLDAWTDTLPSGIDILITHTPPAYHLDNFPLHLGDRFLLRELRRIKPRLHICGHVHAGAGREVLWWDKAQGAYERGLGRKVSWWTMRGWWDVRLWVDLGRVVLWGLVGVVWNRVWGGEERCTVVVNAALMGGNTGRLGERVQVVDV